LLRKAAARFSRKFFSVGDAVSAAVIRALATQQQFQTLPATVRNPEALRRQIARQVQRRLTR